jgi:AcrR family transcriptional regulator
MSMKPRSTPKDKVFETAARLFYQHGYRAIGVDTLAEQSGVGKMTLYRHYPSKDDLMLAYLRDSNELFWRSFDRITEQAATPRLKLMAFFESLQNYVNSPECFGCPFLNVATEYPESQHAGHQVALEHKRSVRSRFRELAKEAGASKPGVLGDQLVLLMDGAYMAARVFGPKNPALHLAAAARALIDAALE